MKSRIEKPKVLYVDDEPENLTGFKHLFRRKYKVLTANSADEALAMMIENEDIEIVISDQRMPGTTGSNSSNRSRMGIPKPPAFC
jgi:two-component system, sensor histidine kinase and response regulator